MCLAVSELYAAAQGGGPGGTGGGKGPDGADGGQGKGPAGAQGPPQTIPIDGGILLLLGAGAAYGAKKIYDSKKA